MRGVVLLFWIVVVCLIHESQSAIGQGIDEGFIVIPSKPNMVVGDSIYFTVFTHASTFVGQWGTVSIHRNFVRDPLINSSIGTCFLQGGQSCVIYPDVSSGNFDYRYVYSDGRLNNDIKNFVFFEGPHMLKARFVATTSSCANCDYTISQSISVNVTKAPIKLELLGFSAQKQINTPNEWLNMNITSLPFPDAPRYPLGMIELLDTSYNNTVIGTCNLAVLRNPPFASATCRVGPSFYPVGLHVIQARYRSDSNYMDALSNTLTVDAFKATPFYLISDGQTALPTKLGDAVVFTVKIDQRTSLPAQMGWMKITPMVNEGEIRIYSNNTNELIEVCTDFVNCTVTYTPATTGTYLFYAAFMGNTNYNPLSITVIRQVVIPIPVSGEVKILYKEGEDEIPYEETPLPYSTDIMFNIKYNVSVGVGYGIVKLYAKNSDPSTAIDLSRCFGDCKIQYPQSYQDYLTPGEYMVYLQFYSEDVTYIPFVSNIVLPITIQPLTTYLIPEHLNTLGVVNMTNSINTTSFSINCTEPGFNPVNTNGSFIAYLENSNTVLSQTCKLTDGFCAWQFQPVIHGFYDLRVAFQGDLIYHNSSYVIQNFVNMVRIESFVNITSHAPNLQASVFPPQATGNVTFYDFADNFIGTCRISANRCIVTDGNALSYLTPGEQYLTAVYSGDQNYESSTSATYTVVIASSLQPGRDSGGVAGETVVAIVVPIVGAAAIIAIAVFFLFFKKRTKYVKRLEHLESKQQSDISPKELQIIEKLTETGDIFKAMFRGTEVVVKIVSDHTITDQETIDQFRLESSIMCGLRHPNVVLFMGHSILSGRPNMSASRSLRSSTTDGIELKQRQHSTKERMCIVIEFMKRGSLYDMFCKAETEIFNNAAYGEEASSSNDSIVIEIEGVSNPEAILSQKQQRFPYFLLLHIAYSAANGINFLHQCNPPVIHRDIKSANVLVDDKWNVKISDFGITQLKTGTQQQDNHFGSFYWTAPEVLGGNLHTEKSDVYSYGIVLWEIFTYGADPYPQFLDAVAAANHVLEYGVRPVLHDHIPPEIKELMVKCWSTDPSVRPTMDEICSFLKQLTTENPFKYKQMLEFESGADDAPKGEKLYYVFTDIEGSSALWEAALDQMAIALKLHNQILRTNIHKWNGYEVRFEGDSYFAVFAELHNAVMFCINSQANLLAAPWASSILQHSVAKEETQDGVVVFRGLRVRMGINAGSSRGELNPVFNRMDYFGSPVNKAARLLGVAHGGQVFVSSSVAADLQVLVSQSPFKEVSLRVEKVGDFYMKGFKNLEPVHQLFCNLYPRRNIAPVVQNPPPKEVDEEKSSGEGSGPKENSSNYLDSILADSSPFHIPYNHINLEELVYSTPQADIYKASWQGASVAAKIPHIARLKEDELLAFKIEATLLRKIKHPNIVSFLGASLDCDSLCIITEFVPGGTLRGVLSNPAITIPYRQKLKWLNEIAMGLSYLHKFTADTSLITKSEIMLVHSRALKPSSILVDENNMLKLSNFGLCRLRQAAKTTIYRGEIVWTSPEQLNGQSFSSRSDIFSFGMLMYEIFARSMPFKELNKIQIAQNLIHGILPNTTDAMPKKYKSLMTKCWNLDPTLRPSSSIILKKLSKLIKQVELP